MHYIGCSTTAVRTRSEWQVLHHWSITRTHSTAVLRTVVCTWYCFAVEPTVVVSVHFK